ncbi:hypothetical protein ANO11243_036590 [Dothideomycetidae sp. 11243]|nr:hypothetical protein ANO11243_036590 [fungal sp. No.11243]
MSSAIKLRFLARHARQTLPPSRLNGQLHLRLSASRSYQTRSLSSRSQILTKMSKRPLAMEQQSNTVARNGQSRSISIRGTGSIKENIKLLWRYHPYHMVGVTVILLIGVYMLGWLNYYYTYYHQQMFHNYPEPVVKQMRKAWYYTEVEFNPQLALRYYAKAIDAARELRMDPYSNEVIGIKECVIYTREKAGDIAYAAKLWETMRADILQQSDAALSLLELSEEERQQRRTRLLKRTVQISVKLAELYSNPEMHNDTSALELLMWSVTTVLRETAARNAINATPETHGEWISNDEFGASLEALGHKYESQNAHYLAAPLFLQALAAKEKTDCHSVVLMNNLAISLAQQNPPAERGVPPPDRAMLVRNARQWAEKALRVAADIAPPVRDEECDTGCATALYNLGEMAEMLEEREEARRKYQEALSLASAIGFVEGEKQAKDALRRLDGRGLR